VTVENDASATAAAPRPGTPQSRHAHVLLAGGQQALTSLFPGFEQDLAQAGTVHLRMASDLRVERHGYVLNAIVTCAG
jgi:hypothetical protein